MSIDFNNPDQQALALTHAIALQESGSGGKPNYTATGDNGTSKGAYQWQPGNFESAAKNAGLDPNDFSSKNQDKVAYSEIKAYKDKGYDPGQIASLWNSGSPNNWQNHSGTTTINGKEISYDTPAYVKGVQNHYKNLLQENSNPDSSQLTTDTNNSQQKTFQDIIKSNPQPTAQPQDLLNNPVSNTIKKVGNFVTFGGAGELGNELGSSLAIGAEKLKGLFGGQDNSQYIAPPNVNKALFGGAKSIIGAGALEGGLKGIQGLVGALKGGSALASEPVVSELTNYATKTKSALNTLSASEKVNVLTEALGKAEAGVKPLFTKALQELAPQVLKEAGIGSFSELNPKLAKVLGLTWKGVKLLTGGVLAGAGIGEGSKIVKGLIN